MRRRTLVGAALVVALVVVGLGVAGLAFAGQLAPGPEQPVNFPHTVHVSALGLECRFCHRGVDTEAVASIPPVEQCLFCHVVVKTNSPEIQKLIRAYQENEPIDWVRVHRQPDHVGFVHWTHIARGFDCATCHGDVTNLDLMPLGRVKQVRALGMGDCVNCHRQNNAPTDCWTCHK
ncbi:MAG: class III cytochrome C domain protein [Dehalococcoidia bacterium]|nr:MAG: class III cytochrome C domain protein [Dehalococcoidia bacterium]